MDLMLTTDPVINQPIRRLTGEFSAAESLIAMAALRNEYNVSGRLIRRTSGDGIQETVSYGAQDGTLTVWVTDHDGRFREARYYQGYYLRYLIQADGTWMSMPQFAKPLVDPKALDPDKYIPEIVIKYVENKILIYQFNHKIRPIQGYVVEPTTFYSFAPTDNDQLGNLISKDELMFIERR